MNNKARTGFLLPKNNFWVGLGSVINIFGNYFIYRTSNSDLEADQRAIASDWKMTGQDIEEATKNFEPQLDIQL